MYHDSLIRKLRTMSAEDRKGFLQHIKTARAKEKASQAKLLAVFLNQLASTQVIHSNQEVWAAWQGTKVYHAQTLRKAVLQLENGLDTFQSPMSAYPIHMRLTQLDTDQQQAFYHYVQATNGANKSEILHLLQTLLQLMYDATDTSRLDFYTKWKPGKVYDPNRLRNRLTSLANLLDGFLSTMRQIKLYNWLQHLEKKQRNQFYRFVKTFGDGRRKELARCLKLFITHIVEGGDLGRRDFFKLWKGAIPYNNSILNHATNSILTLLRQWMAAKELNRHPLEETTYLVRALAHCDWPDVVESEFIAAFDLMENTPENDQYFVYALQIEEAYLAHEVSAPRTQRAQITVERALYLMEQHYILNMLRFAIAAGARKAVLATPFDVEAFKVELARVLTPGKFLSPIATAYHWAFQMHYGTNCDQHFHNLRSALFEKVWNIDPQIERELFDVVANYAAIQMRLGRRSFQTDLSAVYQKAFQRGCLFGTGVVNPAQLRNVLLIFLRTDKVELANQAYDACQNRIAATGDPQAILHVRAILHFFNDQFQLAQATFIEVANKAKDVYHLIDARQYLLEIELIKRNFIPQGPNMKSPFEAEATKFRTFIDSKDRFSELQSMGLECYFFYMTQMHNLLTKPHKKKNLCTEWKALQQKLSEETQLIPHCDWMLNHMKKVIATLKCSNHPSSNLS